MMRSRESQIGEALRWALNTATHPSITAADWLARDIDPAYPSAIAMLTDPDVPLVALRSAKDAFKTMRIVGETSSDRRLGAQLYAAAIAAGLVRHGARISGQSDAALRRAFDRINEDMDCDDKLRTLAGLAICTLDMMS
jgi:hypothetical protein